VIASQLPRQHIGRVNRARFAGGSNSCVGWSIMSKATNKFSPEVRERAVRLVLSTPRPNIRRAGGR
jgi:hypothetical protein